MRVAAGYFEKVQTYFIWFMLYSMLGWIYEVLLEVVVYRWGFSNRGVLYGSYCIIYGFGALLILLVFGRFKRKRIFAGKLLLTPIFTFLGITVMATAVELAGSYLMEWLSGSWMWDYTRFYFHFQGRIALNPSVHFGIGGMAILYIIQPSFEKLVRKLSDQNRAIICIFLAVILFLDISATLLRFFS